MTAMDEWFYKQPHILPAAENLQTAIASRRWEAVGVHLHGGDGGNSNKFDPANATVLDSLDRKVLTYGETASVSDEPCPICVEAFMEDDTVITLDCNHCFHEACVTQWLKVNSVCPMCRGKVGEHKDKNQNEDTDKIILPAITNR